MNLIAIKYSMLFAIPRVNDRAELCLPFHMRSSMQPVEFI